MCERINDKWDVIAAVTEDSFEQVSFVNGVWTIRGGKHVDSIATQLCKKIADALSSRNKAMAHLKPNMVKDKLVLFVKASIPNATFDSQSKELLTTPVAKFGCKVDISDAFVEKLCAPKTGLVEMLQEVGRQERNIGESLI